MSSTSEIRVLTATDRAELKELAGLPNMGFAPELITGTLSYVEALEAKLADYESASSLKDTRFLLAAATARATKAESRAAELRGQVTSLLEDLANGCVPVKMEPGIKTTPYWLGVNAERISNLQWAELKATELGIAWPIKPILYAGNPPSAAPTPPPSSPAAAGPGEAGWFSPLVFDSAADYDASVQHVAARIASGEVQPREPDEAEPAADVWISVTDRMPEGRVKVRTAEGYEAVVAVHETDQGQRYVTCVEWDNPHFSFGLVVGKVVEWCEEQRAPTTTGEGKERADA